MLINKAQGKCVRSSRRETRRLGEGNALTHPTRASEWEHCIARLYKKFLQNTVTNQQPTNTTAEETLLTSHLGNNTTERRENSTDIYRDA